MQLDVFLRDSTLMSLYEDAAGDDYVEEEAGQRLTAREALDRIERWLPRGRLLDLGLLGRLPAGRGARPRLGDRRRRAERVHLGVRPPSTGARRANRGPLRGRPARGVFDVLVGNVIEHLVDPAAALDRVPGGVV